MFESRALRLESEGSRRDGDREGFERRVEPERQPVWALVSLHQENKQIKGGSLGEIPTPNSQEPRENQWEVGEIEKWLVS